jgi:hypothetical protein
MSAPSRTVACRFGGLLLFVGVALTLPAQNQPERPKGHGILANDFQAPISFEPNQGQTDERVKFLARGSGYNLFLTPSNALFFLRQSSSGNDLLPTTSDIFTMRMVGANPAPILSGREELPGKSSYFLGADPKKWRTDISNFGKVQYENVYPGIDLVYHGTQGQLEYDFVLHPGTNPATIAIEFTGMKDIRLSSQGELVLETVRGQICFHKPVAYQYDQGKRRAVEAHYRRIHKHQVGFAVGTYDVSKILIIDPVLIVGKLAETGRRTRRLPQINVPAARISGPQLVDLRGFRSSTSQLGEPGNSEVGTGAPGRERE